MPAPSPQPPVPLRAIFFDAGGTLIRPRRSVGETYARRAAEHGVAADAAAIERRFRRAFAAAPPLAFPGVAEPALERHEQQWWRAIVRLALRGYELDDFEACFQTIYADFARPEAWEVLSDVVPVLAELRRRGLELGVISNFDTRLPPLLRGLGLAGFFGSITFSSAAGAAKPDARIFAQALRRHGVEPAAALHAGDSREEDVEGARAAGMRALLVRTDGAAGLESLLDLTRSLP